MMHGLAEHMAVEACIIVHWIVGHTFYQFCLSELNLEGIQDLIRYPFVYALLLVVLPNLLF